VKTKTTLVIAALAVILGVSFAAWSEQATITINVATGYIDLDFTEVENTACTAPMTCTWSTPTNSGSGNDDGASVTLTLNNAFPGASATYKIKVSNNGTLPVNVACSVPTTSGLTVTLNPSNYNNLAPKSSYTLTVSIAVGNVNENTTYNDVVVTCTYTQAVS